MVEVLSIKSGVVDRAVDGWRHKFKYRLPESVREEVVVERRDTPYSFVAVFRGSLLGLWLALKLKSIAERVGAVAKLYRVEPVTDVEELIDQELRRRLDKIPPELVYAIKKVLRELRLPRSRVREEVIKAMKT